MVDRLARAGLLRDGDFAAECLARVRLELITAALPFATAIDSDAPSLLTRLAQSSDRVVATAAAAVMIGESHRRGVAEGGSLAGTGLPRRACTSAWCGGSPPHCANASRARPTMAWPRSTARIAESALRNVAAHDDNDRLEAAAMRLAEAVDAQPDELPALIDEILRDRRLVVFAAFLAHALGVTYRPGARPAASIRRATGCGWCCARSTCRAT